MSEIGQRLRELREQGLYRRMRMVAGPQGPRVMLDGRRVLLLCSNNYLGFADHPRVREAAAEAAMRYGVGTGASRLVSGNMTLHRRLEERLADFEETERCVLFGSGYLANTGVIAALARSGDVVFSDALNHASIVDGCRLARAETFVYDHLDMEHLEWGLREARGRGSLIVTDGVFSMDGDVAPLAEIVDLARRHDARVLVDEAHATGALGPGGRGSVAAAGPRGRGRRDRRDARQGARRLRRLCLLRRRDGELSRQHRPHADLLDRAAPPSVAAALAALELLREQPRQVERLLRNARALRDALAGEGFTVRGGDTQIVPLIVGDSGARRRGLRARARARRVRPGDPAPDRAAPARARLRLAAMATHTPGELRWAAQQLAAAAARGGRRAGRGSVRARRAVPVRRRARRPAFQRAA